jgi:hypothetical protein
LEVRAREVDARWKQDVQQREEAAQVRLKQREAAIAGAGRNSRKRAASAD